MRKVYQFNVDSEMVGVYCKNPAYEKFKRMKLSEQYLNKTFRKVKNQIKEDKFTYYCAEQNIFMTLEFIRPSYYIIHKIRRMNVYNGTPTGIEDEEIPSYDEKLFLKTQLDGKEIFMSPLAAKKMKQLKIKQHHIDLCEINLKVGAYSSFMKDKVVEFHCTSPNEIVLVNIEEPDIYNYGLRVVANEKG